jgi:hypothetical protein
MFGVSEVDFLAHKGQLSKTKWWIFEQTTGNLTVQGIEVQNVS